MPLYNSTDIQVRYCSEGSECRRILMSHNFKEPLLDSCDDMCDNCLKKSVAQNDSKTKDLEQPIKSSNSANEKKKKTKQKKNKTNKNEVVGSENRVIECQDFVPPLLTLIKQLTEKNQK